MIAVVDLDQSCAVLSAAGAVCRQERELRAALARLAAHPRDPRAWAEARAAVSQERESVLRCGLAVLESVPQTGGAGVVMGGSPRIPSFEEESC